MCLYVEGPRIMPGYGCCRCRVYNGLQRDHCRTCRRAHCLLVVPPDVLRCANCRFAFVERDRALLEGGLCPNCLEALVVAPAEAVH